MTAILLVPSPLLGPATWVPVTDWLTAEGYAARVVPLDGVEDVVAAAGAEPVVLVPHSNAGLHVPALAERLDVRATVYVDAALPTGAGPTTKLAPPGFREFLAELADGDGLLPPWTGWWREADLAGMFPDHATRTAVEAEQPRLPLAWFEREVPVPAGWAQRPSAYLAFGMTYAAEVALARREGWPVRVLDGRHLHQLHDPAGVGRAVLDLLAQVTDDPDVTA